MFKKLISWTRSTHARVIGAITTALAVPQAALAQTTSAYTPVDVSEGVTYLQSIDDSMMSIGVVLFALAAVALGIKWVKATFFG